MLRRTLEIVKAGDHWDFRMSRQMAPEPFIFGWYIFVVNWSFGGIKGGREGQIKNFEIFFSEIFSDSSNRILFS